MKKRHIQIDEARDKRTLSKGEQSELRSMRTQHIKDMENGRHDDIIKRHQDHKAMGRPKDRSQQMHTAMTVMHTAFAQDAKKAQSAAPNKPPNQQINKAPEETQYKPYKPYRPSREQHFTNVYNDAHRAAKIDFENGKRKLGLMDKIRGITTADKAHKIALDKVKQESDKLKALKDIAKGNTMKEDKDDETTKNDQEQPQPTVMDRYAQFISGQAKKLEYSTFGQNRSLTKEDTLHETKWEFEDARGVKTQGTYVKAVEGQGTDVTYHFKDDKGKLHLVSGSRLKKAKRIK